MTKEEALKVIRHMAYLSAHIVENGVEAYEYIEQFLSKPSLPSNLDEAAEKYATIFTDKKGHKIVNEPTKEIFKAGAEWMAGQGVSMQITDDTEWEEVDSFIHKNVDGGSIIQIRKK